MSSKSIYFFATPDDFTSMLLEIIAHLNMLVITLNKDMPEQINFSNVKSLYSELCKRDTNRIYLISNMSIMKIRNASVINFAELGLIAVDVPSLVAETLYLANVSVKTDWLDIESGITYANNEMLVSFNKIKTKISKKCSSGVLIRDKASRVERLVKSIWITKNASDFFENGIELCQRGVANADFAPITNISI